MMRLPFLSLSICAVLVFSSCGNAGKLLNAADQALKSTSSTGLTNEDAANGLKEAIIKGIENGTGVLAQKDGFLKSPTYKIPFPAEAQKIEQALRKKGMGGQVDKVTESLNRAAELAVNEAKPVFINSIKAMSFTDALKIVTGGNNAATNYLKETTTLELTRKFSPVIQNALDKVNATKYWGDVMTIYNKLPTSEKINPDLNAYVTGKALTALFDQIAIEENKIREDPARRATEILKKVFGYADSQKNK